MGDSEPQAESLATSRSRRQKSDRHGRLAALQRLRGLQGNKNKYEVSDLQNVYEEVDEKDYSKKRQERLEDDWIVDDDGSGYVEDGRDFFDYDDDGDEMFVSRKDKASKKSKGSKSTTSSVRTGGSSIKNMLLNMPSKKKSESNVKLDDDDLLGDILNDLSSEPEAPMAPPRPVLLKKKPTKPPFATINHISPKTIRSPVSPQVQTYSKAASLPKRQLNSGEVPKAKRALVTKEAEEEPVSQQIEEYDSMEFNFDDDDDDMENIDITNIEENTKCQSMDTHKAEQIKEEVLDTKPEVIDKPVVPQPVPKRESEVENRGYKSKPVAVDDSNLTIGWESLKEELKETSVISDVQIDSSKLPVTTDENGDQVLRFFWLDAYEDYFNNPGTVYLFGKVWIESAMTHVSCCVAVKNIERRMFVLPRTKKMNLKTKEEMDEEVSMISVYQEFNEILSNRFKIMEFKSRKITKLYTFEKFEVPSEADYMEVRFSSQYKALPTNLEGETFSHVFGCNTSSLEMFLLDQRIKGPCWLEVKNPQHPSPPVSWCKVEAVCTRTANVVPVIGKPPPPLVVMTVNFKTTVNPKSHQNEIVLAGCLVHTQFHLDKPPPQPPFQQHFCAMTHPSDTPWPWDLKECMSRYQSTKVERMDSERALLAFLLAKIHKIDPDIVVGHDVVGFDISVLLHRISTNKIPQWSRLGKLKRGQMPKLTGKGFAEKTAMCGRLVCDVKISAKELIRAKSYDLGALVSQVLRVPESEHKNVTVEEIKKAYDSAAMLLQLVTMTMQDSSFIIRLMCELNVLPLALQITNIAGNVMSRTLLGGRSERNEFLLLHAFTEKNFIPPDKQYNKNEKAANLDDGDHMAEDAGKKSKGKRKPAYAGGLVLEPKKGFYDKFILLMDFNSLYPSIIQEYNICFTTMPRAAKKEEEEEEQVLEMPDPELEFGILPTEIRKLVESRKQVKQLMKQSDLAPDLKMQYDIRQKALKLTANSMYGCLGFSHSRFFARHLAALVTAKGREILLNTRDLVQKMNFDVIYGDTDSIMINTNCNDFDQVFKLGHKIKAEVNKMYKLLELDVDGVFKYMLLLKKKKYAAMTVAKLPNGNVVMEQELKGLDIVRRDWSQLASDAGRHIIQQILSDQGPDERIENIHSHLESLRKNMDEGKVGLDMLAITKQLTKNPEDYPDKKSLPHVQVAIRVNSRGGKKLKQGDTVQYIICEDSSNLAAMQRAYHVDEVKTNSTLTIDKNYYLAHQIHPVVSRLCDPIDGTDAARIAECLGLDPSGYKQSRHYGDGEEDEEMAGEQISDEERYRSCERFTFMCPSAQCDTIISMDGAFRGVGTQREVVLDRCPNPKCNFTIYTKLTPVINKLHMEIQKHINKYYEGWIICDDPGCSNRLTRVPLCFSRGYPICNVCEKGFLYREYTDSQLYKQLCFYDHMFDFTKACTKYRDERIRNDTLRKAYNVVHMEVQKILKLNAYAEVNLSKLFAGMFAKPEN
ncbi:DNA polymerase alpha catalytic subunit [Oratosquilla oratoria]|uniref:DNA polymerase alpha catalytic subunit n=1 Tax=Oratosquilla oratoria TaxID=337810 RepID=UPI003F7743C0